jgi:hypothetical protein
MVELKSIYEQAGFALATNELPDYLPMLLEYLSCRNLVEARRMLADCAHILKKIAEALISLLAIAPITSCYKRSWSWPPRSRWMPHRYRRHGSKTSIANGSRAQPLPASRSRPDRAGRKAGERNSRHRKAALDHWAEQTSLLWMPDGRAAFLEAEIYLAPCVKE